MLGILKNQYRTANTLFGRRSLCTSHDSPNPQVQKTSFPCFELIELGVLFFGVFYVPYKILNEKRKSTNETEEKEQSQSRP
ncbi:hypothetical protein [Legionella shakespearei]|uniref:Uncharacterized protein n=1 Tax=Legionella shakespearei DSM 23087 TaxID=1122169 RepID=A0A0W0YVP5_9GAMM|nr:hypothetical protein [Legionella shakespearei]KTD60981.1 hypothetical protein Lsha_1392 [Legionella shakespearei DSM 23087]